MNEPHDPNRTVSNSSTPYDPLEADGWHALRLSEGRGEARIAQSPSGVSQRPVWR
jgi:hypothetical protein